MIKSTFETFVNLKKLKYYLDLFAVHVLARQQREGTATLAYCSWLS